MKSQTIQELEALTPVEMDAGLVFSGVPTGFTHLDRLTLGWQPCY